MKHLVELAELKSRAAAIGINLGDLSREAGFAHSTAYQVIKHRNPKVETLAKLGEVLTRREIRLRDYLIGLHGVPRGEGA